MVGATVPINTLITALETNKDSSPASFPHLADHLKEVANIAVRNVQSKDMYGVCSDQVNVFNRSAVGLAT